MCYDGVRSIDLGTGRFNGHSIPDRSQNPTGYWELKADQLDRLFRFGSPKGKHSGGTDVTDISETKPTGLPTTTKRLPAGFIRESNPGYNPSGSD